MSSLKEPIAPADIEMRIAALVYEVQDPNRSNWFKPGTRWWMASGGDGAKTKHKDVVHFLDQIGVDPNVMEKHFGRQWMSCLLYTSDAADE